MPKVIEAIYENGVFKPLEKVDLREGEKVRLKLESAEDIVKEAFGILKGKDTLKALKELEDEKILEGDERARDLIVELYSQENLYRNTVVYSEVVFVWVKLTTGMRSYELRECPEYFKVLKPDFAKVDIMDSYGLLPNDVLIAATCRHYGIRKIATFDEDFKRVDFLEVVEP